MTFGIKLTGCTTEPREHSHEKPDHCDSGRKSWRSHDRGDCSPSEGRRKMSDFGKWLGDKVFGDRDCKDREVETCGPRKPRGECGEPKPPVCEQPPVCEEPPVEEPPVCEEPPVITTPKPETPQLPEEPCVVVGEPPVVEEPPVAEEPPVVVTPKPETPQLPEEPCVIVGEPPVVSEPPVVEEPPVAEEPPVVVTPKPELPEEPCLVIEPPVVEEPQLPEEPCLVVDPPVTPKPTLPEAPCLASPQVAAALEALAGAGDDAIEGTDEGETLIGTGDADVILGHGGDDVIKGKAGDDVIDAGDGDDVIRTGAGDDTVFGGAGDDRLVVDGAGVKVLVGGDGVDTVKLPGQENEYTVAETANGARVYTGLAGLSGNGICAFVSCDVERVKFDMPPAPEQPQEPELPEEPCDPIGVENGACVWGDPHFVGAEGGKYDVQGQAGSVYNILSDAGIQVNAEFVPYGSNGATVMGRMGVTIGDAQIEIGARGALAVNGETITEDGSYLDGMVTKSGTTITVQDEEYVLAIKAGDHLNIDFASTNVVADGVKPHGLWGQTADGDGVARNGDTGSGAQGGGAIEGADGEITQSGDKQSVALYEVASLFDTSFTTFNRFAA